MSHNPLDVVRLGVSAVVVALFALQIDRLPGPASTRPRSANAEPSAEPNARAASWEIGAVRKKISTFVLAAFVIVTFLLTFALLKLNTVPVVSAQDEGALFYGARSVIETGSVRISNELAAELKSGVIGNLYAAYRTPDDYFFRAFPGSVLLNAALIVVGGNGLFWSSNAVFGAFLVVAVLLTAYQLTRHVMASAFSAVIIATSPAFMHWGVSYFNNIPVVALEMFAIFFLFRLRDRASTYAVLAGACIAGAIFLRTTEILYAVPFLLFVWFRTRSVPIVLRAAAPILIAGGSLAVVNVYFYGNALFQPHLAPTYLAPDAGMGGPGALERYAMFILGTQGSISNAQPHLLFANYFFHLNYFLQSTFALPLLIPILAGTVFGVARGWPEIRLPLIFAATALLITIFFYGNQSNNYYGYGQDIVRSSFVRYLMLTYALVAVLAGVVFARAATSVSRAQPLQRYALAAGGSLIIVLAAILGFVQSRDADRYGLDRLNLYRSASAEQQSQLNELVREADDNEPLIFSGFTTGKIVDLRLFPNTIDYSEIPEERWPAELISVIRTELHRRPIYVLATPSRQQDRDLINLLRSGGFELREESLGYDSVFIVGDQ